MQRAASDIQPNKVDEKSEALRSEVEAAVEAYVNAHYPNGSSSVYGQSEGGKVTIIICVEDHEFQSRNHWGGRWVCYFFIDNSRSNWHSSVRAGRSK